MKKDLKKYGNLIKISFLLLGIGMLFSFGISSSAAANSSTIYVSDNGNDNWNGLNSTWTPNTLNGPKSTVNNATGTVKSGGIVYIANGKYSESNIQIFKNMSIIGQNQQNTIITGLKGSIFFVGKGVSVNLINMTIMGGTSIAQGGGGAVHNDGFLSVNGVSFVKNYADNTGGAIYNKGTLNVTNSNFMGNVVETQGGAISNDGKLSVTNSTFSNNGAGQYGGAIFNNGVSNLVNDNFEANTASTQNGDGSNGGAVYNTATMNITKSTFNNNHATNNGGAIFNEKSAGLTVNSSKFTKNYSSDHGYGGSVGNDGSASIFDSWFSQNTAIPGGAIGNMGSLNLTSCTFDNNTAMQYGGAVLNAGTMKINKVSFSNNSVTKGMGGALANAGSLTVTGKNSFIGNQANNGGAIYNAGNMLINPNTVFSANNATNGGCIYNGFFQNDEINSMGNATVIGNTFQGNTASTAGAILNDGSISVVNSTFSNNKATEGGAVVNGGVMTIYGSSFNGNQAVNDGGALINVNKKRAAAAEAKAKALNAAKATATTASSTKSDAVSYLKVLNCSFTGNSAPNGGAICNTGNMTLVSSTFSCNTATTGGAISNHAPGSSNSGAVKAAKEVKTTTVNDKATADPENSTTTPTEDLPESTITGCTFVHNNANQGNIIYNSYVLDVHFCRIIGNNSTSIIYSDNGTVNATLNWWGSNSNPSKYVAGNVTVDPWMVLNIKANSTSLKNGKTCAITSGIVYDSNGIYHNPVNGHVPDGIPLKFIGTHGTINQSECPISNGQIGSTYNSKQSGTATITSTVDNQSVSTNLTVTPVSDLYIKITTSIINTTVGSKLTVTYKLGNIGPDTATNVTISIPLPDGFLVTNISGDGSWKYNETNNMLTWILATVPVGDPYLYITGKPAKTGTYDFTTTLTQAALTVNVKNATNSTNNTANNTSISVDSNKTIPMQNTGIPIAGLVFGVLSLMGGIISTRKR